jgi:hypothetical protein
MFNKTSSREKISFSKTLKNIPFNKKFDKQSNGACHVRATPSRQRRPRASAAVRDVRLPSRRRRLRASAVVRSVRPPTRNRKPRVNVPRRALCAIPPEKRHLCAIPPEREDRASVYRGALCTLSSRKGNRERGALYALYLQKEKTASQCTAVRYVRPTSRTGRPCANVPRCAMCALSLEREDRHLSALNVRSVSLNKKKHFILYRKRCNIRRAPLT